MFIILQRASYHYVNVQAQFQIFNEKNWFYMEDGLRDFVIKSGKDYTVYTGSHGVMELDDINNNKVEIYLNLERPDLARLPAPRYVIRVVKFFEIRTDDLKFRIFIFCPVELQCL